MTPISVCNMSLSSAISFWLDDIKTEVEGYDLVKVCSVNMFSTWSYWQTENEVATYGSG